eukprot:TRINITY_DN942_c1_g1_i1.p1 TRINITY_DN942_c1_g1~~TRINITY_DN942_c1_g1_i1.p1  ORF type:complete len:178 (+),score=50.54 TRINITY_DN942_c1_g1_i1:57-536(+)
MPRRRLNRLESIEARPCDHNDWDDVRTRKGYKVLRCRECQQRWKIPSTNVPRCMAFFNDCCLKDVHCEYLHVRRKKNSIIERFQRFGEKVLEGVGLDLQSHVTVCGGLSDDVLLTSEFLSSDSCSSDSDDNENPYMTCFAPPLWDAPTCGWYDPTPIEA